MKLLIQTASLLLCTFLAHAGYLGFGLEVAKDGAVVRKLVDGGPAAKAGLQNGDMILKIDGKPAVEPALAQIVKGLGAAAAGTKVAVVYRRGGKQQDAEIVLGERPAPVAPPDDPKGKGPALAPPNKWLRKRLPDFTLDHWYQLPAGVKAIHRKDFDGKVVLLYFFTAGEQASRGKAFSIFKTAAETLKGRANALPLAVHIADKDGGKNTVEAALKVMRKHDLHFVPMAHVPTGDKGHAALTKALDVPGRPYYMIIDRGGVVRLAEPESHPMMLLLSLEQLGIYDEEQPAPAKE